MASSSKKEGTPSKRKRPSFNRAASEVISLKQALELDRRPEILSPSAKSGPAATGSKKKKSTGEENQEVKDGKGGNKKYVKIPTEFHVGPPLRREIGDKNELRKAHKEAGFVERRNPDYASGSKREHEGDDDGGEEVSSSSSDEDDRMEWDKMEPDEAVRSFKLIKWRSTYIGMIQSAYAEMEWRYLVNKIPEHEIGIEVAAVLFPFLFLLCLWDTIATSSLDLVHMTQIPFFGAFMIVYTAMYPIMLYGYIIRHCYGIYGRTRRSKLAFLGIVLYPLLFVYFCVNDIVYHYARDEAGIYYHQFKRGPEDYPDDYDPEYDYVTKDYRTQYGLGHYTFYDVSSLDLTAREEEEDRVPVRALSPEERYKIMTMT